MNVAEVTAKARVLLEALPYIQDFRGSIFVVKYGGSFMDDPDPIARTRVAYDIAFLAAVGINVVVVNGGAAQQVSLFVAGTAWPASVTPYVTTSSSKLAAGTAITVTAGAFSASLDAQSVTTFVGKP